jgi:hypothetical protein
MWLYNDQPFTAGDIGRYQGFVYIVTDTVNLKRYVGRKTFWFAKTLPPSAGMKRKRRKTIESDWASYCSSSPTIKALVAEHGISRFKREIVYLFASSSEMAYLEAKLQFEHDVLLSDDWYNDYIQFRISGKHLKGPAQHR